jgi:hypothetical protein
MVKEFLDLLNEYGPDYVISLLIRYAELQDDDAHQELIKDLKRAQHRFRTLSG